MAAPTAGGCSRGCSRRSASPPDALEFRTGPSGRFVFRAWPAGQVMIAPCLGEGGLSSWPARSEAWGERSDDGHERDRHGRYRRPHQGRLGLGRGAAGGRQAAQPRPQGVRPVARAQRSPSAARQPVGQSNHLRRRDGCPTRSSRSTSWTAWIEQVCKISWPPDGSNDDKAEDAALLIRAKDRSTASPIRRAARPSPSPCWSPRKTQEAERWWQWWRRKRRTRGRGGSGPDQPERSLPGRSGRTDPQLARPDRLSRSGRQGARLPARRCSPSASAWSPALFVTCAALLVRRLRQCGAGRADHGERTPRRRRQTRVNGAEAADWTTRLRGHAADDAPRGRGRTGRLGDRRPGAAADTAAARAERAFAPYCGRRRLFANPSQACAARRGPTQRAESSAACSAGSA